MNKIYKVLWNRSRECHVVTDEAKKTRKKGKVHSVVDCTAGLAFGALIGSALFATPAAWAASAVTQTNIKADSSWSHTHIQSDASGKVHNITTDYKTDANIGINKFSDFELKAEHIANLHFADGSNDLVNFVNNTIKVDGTVNAIKGSAIGGNLTFVSPGGMTVGSTGVINAGSFTAVAPDQDTYDKLSKVSSGGHMLNMTETAYQNLRQGEVPLNPNAIITVSGSINAGNRVTLAAGKLKVDKTARIDNTVTDFSNLVNIKKDDVVVTASGLTGSLSLVPDAGSDEGDILLLARADTSAFSVAPNIKAEITVDGTVKSRGDLTVTAMAGNGTYDVEKTLDADKDEGHFTTSGNKNIATVTAEVTVNGKLEAAEDLTVQALAENRINDSDLIRLAENVSLEMIGMATPINGAVAYGDLTTNAHVTVSNGAELIAGGNLSTEANADTRMTIGTSTSKIQLLDLFNLSGSTSNKIPAAAAVVGLIDSTSTVDIAGQLSAGKDLTVASRNNIDAELTAKATTFNSDGIMTALMVGVFEGSSSANITKTAQLSIQGGNYSATSEQTNSVSTSASASAGRNSYGGLAFNYTELNTGSHLDIETGLSGTAKEISLLSSNYTDSYSVVSNNAASSGGFMDRLTATGSAMTTNFMNALFNQKWGALNSSYSSPSAKVGGAITVVTGGQASDLVLDPALAGLDNASLTAQDKINVSSKAEIWDYQFKANSSVSNAADASGNHSALQGSLALLVQTSGKAESTLSSDLTIGDNAMLTVNDGNLTVTNEAVIEWHRLEAMKAEFEKAKQALNDIYHSHDDKDSAFEAQWKKFEEQCDKVDEAFGEISSDKRSFTEKISQLGTSLAELASAAGEFLKLAAPVAETGVELANIGVSLFAFVQPTSYLNTSVSASGSGAQGSWDAAGTVAVLLQDTQSSLTIGKGASLTAKGALSTDPDATDVAAGAVTITGRSVNESLTLAGHVGSIAGIPIPGSTEANAVGGTLLYQALSTDNQVMVREGASLTATNIVNVSATDSVFSLPIAVAADISKGSFGFDALASLSDIDTNNELLFDDEAQITANDIVLNASRDDSIQTIAGAIDLGTGSGASTGIAAGVAINLGSLGNRLSISDNDKLLDGQSLFERTDGGLYAAAGSVTVTANTNLAMNAIGAALVAEMSGEDDPSVPDPDSKLQKVLDFFKSVGDYFSGLGDKVSGKIGQWSELLTEKSTEWGSTLRNEIFATQDQNNSSSDVMAGNGQSNDQRFGDNGANGQANASAGVSEQNSAANSQQGKHLQLALAGSAGWNDFDAETGVTIDVDHFTVNSQTADIEAVTDKWVGAWAGAAGLNFIKKHNDASNGVSIAGAIAGNTGSYKSTVSVTGDLTGTHTGLHFGENTADINIYAINDGTLVAEGLAASITKGGDETSNWAFDGNVSVNWLDTETAVTVSGISAGTDDNAVDFTYDQAAWSGETQVTGGTGFGLTTESSFGRNATFGLIFALADLDNTITSTLSEATLNGAQTVDVRALSSLTQVTTAVSAQVALGSSALGFSGAAASSDFTNTVTAGLSNAAITLTGLNAHVEVASRDTNDSEDSYFDSISDVQWYPEAASELTNLSYYEDVGLITDTSEDNTPDSSSAQTLKEFLDGSNMLQTSVVLSLGIAPEDNSGAAGVLVNHIDNVFSTNTAGLNITSDTSATDSSFIGSSEANVVSVGVVAGAAGSGGSNAMHFSAAGSVLVSNVNQQSVTTAEELTLDVAENTIRAGNSADTVNVAGNVGVSVGGGESTIAIGGAVVVMNTNNDAQVRADSLNVTGGTLDVLAQNEANAWAAAADGAVSSGFSFGGAVAVNRVKNTATIEFDHSTLNNVISATLHALDDTETWTLAGNIAVNTGSSGAGISGAVGYSISGRADSPGTSVTIDGLTVKGSADTAEGAVATDLNVTAEGKDRVSTLVLSAGGSASSVGLGGAAGVNEIKRHVNATVDHLVSETVKLAQSGSQAPSALGNVNILAMEDADIDNLGIVAAYGQTAGVGLGIAVNRIDNETTAGMSGSEGEEFHAESLSLQAKTDNDIDTIGIGGGIGSSGSGSGSVSINLIDSDTTVDVKDLNATVDAYGIINAQSDDTIGAYTGNVAGSAGYSAALSVTVNEKHGKTETTVTDSNLTHTGASSTTGNWTTGVADDAINDGIVNDVDVAANLVDKRATETVNGLAIGASSTETYKTFVINGSGAATAAGAGTVSVTYHGGSTKTKLDNADLSASGSIDVFSGDYANIDTVSTTVAGASTASVPISVNVMTTEHTTETEVGEGSISAQKGEITIAAQAKEGVSGLAINGGGAANFAVGALVNVTRELSDVTTNVHDVGAISGSVYNQNADYLGRLTTMGLNAAGAMYGAGTVSVSVNYADNGVNSLLNQSRLSLTDEVNLNAHRRSDWSFVDVNVAGSIYGSLGTYVAVNTLEGQTQTTLDQTVIEGQDGKNPDVSILSGNTENFDSTIVGVSGAAFGNVEAMVVVNRYYGDANLAVNASTINAHDLTLKAYQDHFIDQTSVTVSGAIGTIQANVLANFIGDYVEPGETEDSYWDNEDLKGIGSEVNGYVDEYGSASSESNPGILGSLLTAGEDYLSDTDKSLIIHSAATATEAASTAAGTTVTVSGTKIQADTVSITAEEDRASDAGIEMTVGGGEIGGATIAASVGTLRLNHNAHVTIAGSEIQTKAGGTIASLIGGHNQLDIYQASVTLASGTAAYADAAINGQAQVQLNHSTLTTQSDNSTLHVIGKNESDNVVNGIGIIAGGITGGGIVGDLRDTSSVLVDAVGGDLYGNIALEGIRAQSLTATAAVGQAGVINGAGGLARIHDSGSVRITVDGVTHGGIAGEAGDGQESVTESDFTVKANDETQSFAHSFGVSASVISNVGVAQATIDKTGSTDVTIKGSTFANDRVNVTAAGGIQGSNDSEAMQLNATTESYGGSVVGTFLFNEATVNNTYGVNLTVEGGDYSASNNVNLLSSAYVRYDVLADTGSGGLLNSGNNKAEVNHGVQVTTLLNDLGLLKALTANAINADYSTLTSESAGGGILSTGAATEGASPATTNHFNTAQTTMTVKGELHADEDLYLAAENIINAGFKADNTLGTGIGSSGALLNNSNTTTASVLFDKNATVVADGKLTARASTNSDLHSADGYYVVDSGVYGLAAGSEISLNNTENNTNTVQVADGARVESADDMVLEAKTVRHTDLRTRSRTAGVVNGATAYNTHNILSNNHIDIDKASVSVTGLEKTLTAAASAEETIHAEAIGDFQGGLAGGAGAHVNLTLTRTDTVDVAQGAEVFSAGDMALFAGRDATGKNADLKLTGYAHAYAKGLISGADVKLTDPMTLNNHVNIDGDVSARNNIDVVAFSGDTQTTEMARYYHWTTDSQAADRYEIASSANGTKSGSLTENNKVTVNGSLIAGFATSSDITISGIDLPESNDFTITAEGNQKPLEVTQEGEEAQFSVGVEDIANVYWERHQEIQRILAEYGANATDENRSMMVALKAEDAYLLQMMADKGFATQDSSGQWQLTGSQERGYVSIRDLVISGGNINFTTDSVTGSQGATIQANAADHINITNESNLVLHLENVYIDEKGGAVTLNDQSVGTLNGFAGTLVSQADAKDPTMSVTSAYNGSLTVTGQTQDGKTATKTIVPDTSLVVNGLIGNRAGNVTINVKGDITLESDATVSAAGSVTMGATGSVMQSYTDGIFNVSGEGSVEKEWASVSGSVSQNWKDNFVNKGNTTENVWSGSQYQANQVQHGAIVAGGDIFIAGETINLNGTVQSGFAEYGLDINAEDLAASIEKIKQNWQNAGSPESFDVKSQSYQIVQGGYKQNAKGEYVWQVGAWYDPLNDRVVIDDVTPQGGHIYLTGQIASTGGGNLIVADGHASVTVDAGNHDLLTGNIETGNLAGSITITDTAFRDANRDALVTVYTKNEAGALVTQSHDLLVSGESGSVSETAGWSAYSPKDGLLYAWSEGWGTTNVVTKSDSEDFYLWGAIDMDPDHWENQYTTVKEKEEMSSAGTVGSMGRPTGASDSDFVAWGEYKNVTAGEWDIHTWTEYHDFLHFSGTHYGEATQTTTSNYLLTYTVKADKDVQVGTLTGNNTISLTSDKSVLLGGSLRAEQGSVSIEAGQDILNHSGFAGLYGAADISLTAGGSIGTQSSAIKIADSGNLALKAQAAGDLYLDASAIKQGALISASTLTAGGNVDVISRGDLSINELTGTNLALSSVEGNITIDQLTQKATIDGTQRFDASAKNVTISNTTTDLAVGLIKAEGSVSIKTDHALLDAQDRTDTDTANAQQKIQAWIEAGIINADGSAATEGGMSQTELLFAIADSIINPDPGATPEAGSANIIGETISIESAAVGSSDGVLTGSFSDFGTEKGQALYEALSRADVGDAVWDFENQTVSVQTRRPIIVKQTGEGSTLDITAPENIFIQSTDDSSLRVNQIVSSGPVRLISANGIYGTAQNLITGSTITLRGGTGGIGTADTAINIAHPDNLRSSQWVALSASDAIYIDSSDALSLYSVATDTGLYLSAASVSSYNGEADASEEVSTDELGYINAPVIEITVANGGDVGSDQAALRIRGDASVQLAALDSTAALGSVYLKTVTNGTLALSGFSAAETVSINADGLKATGLIASGNDLTLEAAGDMLVSGLKSESGAISATANALSATGSLVSAKDLTLKATADMSLTALESESGAISVTANNLNATGLIDAAGAITLNSTADMGLSGLKSDSGSVNADAGGKLSVANGSQLSAQNGQLTLSAKPVVLGSGLTVESQGLSLETNDNVALTDTKIQVGSGGLSLTTDGLLSISGTSALQSSGAVTLSGTQGVSLGDSSRVELTGEAAALSVRSDEGALSFSGSSTLIASGSTTLSGTLGVHFSDESTLQSNANSALTIQSDMGSVELTAGQTLQASSISIQAAGKLIAKDLGLLSGSDITLSGEGLDLRDTSFAGLTESALAGTLTLKASASSLDLTQTHGFNAGNLTISAQGNIAFAEKETLNAAQDLRVESTAGSVVLENGSIQASQLIRLAAMGGDLDLMGTNTADDTITLTAGTVSLQALQELVMGEAKAQFTAQSGTLTVKAGSLSLAAGSSLVANNELSVDASNFLSVGDSLSMKGSSVSLTGGKDHFALGNGASFKATNGAISVLASGDATLGGSLTVNATAENDAAPVTIGAQGVLSVTGNDFTVEATQGDVTVYGGQGMNILDNLTVITDRNALIKTGAGNLSIGNNAQVMAGSSVDQITQGIYGVIGISAGENLTIGDNAKVFADNLDIQALNGDIRFGNNADLYGLTDGVNIVAETGSIYMGENLTVHSKAEETILQAADDIVIERSASLMSSGNAIEFEAGGDIIFDDDFLATGKAFTLSAGGRVSVGDNAYVHTDFGETLNSEINFTTIEAADGISFGEKATFETTDLLMTAGVSQGSAADIVLGDNALVSTTDFGIVVTATGDVLFGNNAVLKTSQDNLDHDIALQAGGTLTMGDNASIAGMNRVSVIASEGINFGKKASILNASIDDSDSVTLVQTNMGNITLGEEARISGQNVSIWASDEDMTHGGSVFLGDGALIEVDSNTGSLNLQAYDSIVVENQLTIESQDLVNMTTRVGDIILGEGANLTTAADMTLTSGRDILMGNNASLTTALSGATGHDDVVMTAQGTVSFGDNTRMESDAMISISATEGDVSFGKNASVGVQGNMQGQNGVFSISAQKGSVTVDDGSVIYGQQAMTIQAGESITLTGDVWLDSDKRIDLDAQGGDILMQGSVQLGGFDDSLYQASEEVVLSAAGDVLQSSPSGMMGISAVNLSVTAQGDVSLGANGSTGANEVQNAQINAGGNVTLAFEYFDTALTVNGNGSNEPSVINGDFVLIGNDNTINLGSESVSVAGEAVIKAQNLEGLKGLEAAGDVQLILAGEQDLVLDSIKGQYVGISTQSGGITVGSVSSEKGTEVIRTDTQSASSVNIGRVDSGENVLVINGSGTVSTGPINAQEEIWVFAQNAADIEHGEWTSGNSQAAAFGHAQQVIGYLKAQAGGDVGELTGHRILPALNFAAFGLNQAVTRTDSSVLHDQTDVLNPNAPYFFMHLRKENTDESGLPILLEPEINNEWIATFELEDKSVLGAL